MAMSITSPVFRHESAIPQRYTCEGDDVSPPLVFDGVPTAAASLALIVEDPDAPDPAAPKCVSQYSCEITTTGSPPARATSSGRGNRPSAGRSLSPAK